MFKSFQHSSQEEYDKSCYSPPSPLAALFMQSSEDALTISLAIFTLTSSFPLAVLSEVGARAFLLSLEHASHIAVLALPVPRMLSPQKLYDKLSSFLRRQALPPINSNTPPQYTQCGELLFIYSELTLK